ncbi:putative HECT-type ubiquitin ligase-interacting protein creD [Lachnellula arida]|uniref:Putative HECT-type ubiquitin ligase-interacting protein creD n=1 Tax=Lachnellula arida TaxID=1316785 RepID=A0A8T9BKN3_9HELO|nr:putative HECT-type ubiquitin ligase-interacting protein creD [Lachnellula arida]
MPSFFSGVTGKSSATLFEIRLDNEVIILRGEENEASSQILKGSVVLCLPAALRIEDVHLRMTGHLKVGWTDMRMTASGVSTDRVSKTTEIFSHRWPAFEVGNGPGSASKHTSTLLAGNYEWPFELVIPGSMAESVEGLHESHIVYKLKATVARGKLAYDLHAWKPVRVVRTLDPSALELAHAMTVENVWPNKIEYQLIIPQKAIIFGTAIDVEMRFTSLLKGLRIGQIKCLLIEEQEFRLPGLTAQSERRHKHTRDIDNWTFEMNEEEHYHDLLEDGQDGYVLKEQMPLPKKLSRYIQDVEVHGIKIRHKVKFTVALHNPDGHVSELRATLPVTVFISPNMPLTSDGALVDQTPMSTQSTDIVQHAPPLYGEHILDQLYADMDQTGLMTPAPHSGMNTPFYAQSRHGSSENLSASHDGSAHPTGAVPPAALSSRLQNLNALSRNSSFVGRYPGNGSGGNTPHHHSRDSEASHTPTNGHSGRQSNTLSRRTSEEEDHPAVVSNMASGQHTPEHIDFSDLGDLTKVPSYATAVKTPVRGMSYSDALPNYNTATSAPPSPQHTFANHQNSYFVGAEIHNGGSTPHRERANPMASLGFTPIHPVTPLHPPVAAHTGDIDEERRLHVLQHRDRH